MADICTPTPEESDAWDQWVAELPGKTRVVAERFKPWKLYRLKPSGHRATLVSFGEATDGSVLIRVNVSGEYNLLAFERDVFGISPDDLEECELPAADEPLGSAHIDPHEAVKLLGDLPN
jgi:hypothetical protein